MSGFDPATITQHGAWLDAPGRPAHAISDALAAWIAGFLHYNHEETIRDFGCGTGGYLKVLKDAGYPNLFGYELDPPSDAVFEGIRPCNIALPFVCTKPGHVICLEVAEHVPKEFEQQFLDNICGAVEVGCKIIFSWAPPGQSGAGHVNCQPLEYVEAELLKRKIRIDARATASARAGIRPDIQSQEMGHLPWFRTSTLVGYKDYP